MVCAGKGLRLGPEQVNKRAAFSAGPSHYWLKTLPDDVGIGVQKTGKLIERDQVSFIIGDVNSGIAERGFSPAALRWMREQGMFDPARLVFIDETSANTKMVRL